MNPRHCLTCKRWDRHCDDQAVGYCVLGEELLPLRTKIRFQFEACDCGGYVFAEHRQPHRERVSAYYELPMMAVDR